MDAPPAGLVFSHPDPVLRTRGLGGLRYLFARGFLLDLPRAAAARTLGARLRGTLPDTTVVPFVWHLVSHGPSDPLGGRGPRRPAGDPSAFGGLRDTEAVATALAAQVESTRAIGADTWLVHSPPSITPGPVGRQRLADFFARSRALGFAPMWLPEGLWEADDAAAFARSHDVRLLWPVGPQPDSDALPAGALAVVRPRRPHLRPAEVDSYALLQARAVVFAGPHAPGAAARYLRETTGG